MREIFALLPLHGANRAVGAVFLLCFFCCSWLANGLAGGLPSRSPLPPPPTRTRCACLINHCWAAGGRWCGGAEGRALWVNFGCCAIVHKWFVCSRLYPCSLSLSLLSVSPPPASSCCPFCTCGIDPSACMPTVGSSPWFMCVCWM